MKRSIWSLMLTGAIVLVLGAVALRVLADDNTGQFKGKAAPDLKLTTLDNKEVDLASQKGKVVLLDFWATWCPPCRAALPHLNKMANDKELAEKGLVVWAVNAREGSAQIKNFLKQNNYDLNVPMDTKGAVMEAYKVDGIPTQVVVGRDGIIKTVLVGFNAEESPKALDDAVNAALAEKSPEK